MKQKLTFYPLCVFVAATLCLSGPAYGTPEKINVSYLYTLSNFAGKVPFSGSKISIDQNANEIYVMNGVNVKIFNNAGMEIFSFNEDGQFGNILDSAVDNQGNIVLLSFRSKGVEIIRCNYRGELISTLELKNLPPEFQGFGPNSLVFRNNLFYLASKSDMRVVVVDETGVFKKGYDFTALLEFTEKELVDTGMGGFDVDPFGNMLFTVSAIGRAYIASPDGQVRNFGVRGSRPGTFGVPGGIASDASGKYILVADRLKCKVIVYDSDLKFNSEFGYRGYRPGNLLAPSDVAVDRENHVYVSQMGKRGVNVYRIAQ